MIPSFRIWVYELHVEHVSCVFMNCDHLIAPHTIKGKDPQFPITLSKRQSHCSHHYQMDSPIAPITIKGTVPLLPSLSNGQSHCSHHYQMDSPIAPITIKWTVPLLPSLSNGQSHCPHHYQMDSPIAPHHYQRDSHYPHHHQRGSPIAPHGVGVAVRFLVVGTIGQEERPPRGQLWMEQCLA